MVVLKLESSKINMLHLSLPDLTEEHIKSLTGLPQKISSFTIEINGKEVSFTNHLITALIGIPNFLSMNQLAFRNITVNEESMVELCKLLTNEDNQLSDLEIHKSPETTSSIHRLGVALTHVFCKLKKLKLHFMQINITTMKALTQFIIGRDTRLTEVHLHFDKIDEVSLKQLIDTLVEREQHINNPFFRIYLHLPKVDEKCLTLIRETLPLIGSLLQLSINKCPTKVSAWVEDYLQRNKHNYLQHRVDLSTLLLYGLWHPAVTQTDKNEKQIYFSHN
jgi:hypothetical protein